MYNIIVVLGPTACGKTSLGVALANALCGEIISADSRQVYRGLDIGTGKDLSEYSITLPDGTIKQIPYHLIDIVSLPEEYSVYDFQQDAYKVITLMQQKNKLPIVVGGTGMYLDALIRGYDLIKVPTNQQLRKRLEGKPMNELVKILGELKGNLHNTTDLTERHRLLRAIEIAVYYSENHVLPDNQMPPRPNINPLIIGTTFPRVQLRENITKRLRSRLKEGMIEEVQQIHDSGISWERLERLGLEYKFVSQFLQGKIETQDELFKHLNIAIGQFAKRQETWFRGMERKGIEINWLDSDSVENRFFQAMKLVSDLSK